MHSSVLVVLTVVVVVTAGPTRNSERIVGGTVTTIDRYPFATPLLYSPNLISYWQSCGGSILTSRTVLSAGHCFFGDAVNRWRIRVGSSWANSGGAVHILSSIVIHPQYNNWNLNNDVAVLRSATEFIFGLEVQPASIAGSHYEVAPNQEVWAIGWGTTSVGGSGSEQLRHVQVWSVDQAICANRYSELGWPITDSMLCSGWLDVGGRDQCQGDSGGPLLHNNVIVGVCSWGYQCALARYPGVNAKVSRFTSWIVAEANSV